MTKKKKKAEMSQEVQLPLEALPGEDVGGVYDVLTNLHAASYGHKGQEKTGLSLCRPSHLGYYSTLNRRLGYLGLTRKTHRV